MTFATLAHVPAGFAAPGPASQVVFRHTLEALSRPGRCIVLPSGGVATLEAPAGLSTAMAALLLTLLDGEASIWLSPSLDQPILRQWLAFHTGVDIVEQPEDAHFVAARCTDLDLALWTRLSPGTDEHPQRGATLLLEVRHLRAGEGLRLSGPGIADSVSLDVGGVAPAVWARRQADQPRYPLGVDLLLCCGGTLAGLPRSTRLQAPG